MGKDSTASRRSAKTLSLTIRDYRTEDREQVEAIHAAQGLDYEFPNIDGPLFFIRKVAEVNGKIVAAAVIRVCAETMLLLDKKQGPQDKMTEIVNLQASVLSEAYKNGLDDICAAVPDIGFDKRLRQLGWTKDRPDWHLWSRQTNA